MHQLKAVWDRLDRKKQIIAGTAAVLVFAGILSLARMTAGHDMKLLYAGLENSAAGDVVQALEQRGVPYQIRGTSIFVPSDQRDALRMTLAGEGLPSNGSRGYELLDSLTGFGTTSQMFDAAYWRAKEGELARTIVANPHIAQARVHIASNGANPFRRTVAPTASVALTSASAAITPQQARAIQFLVASAVAGLTVENVAVVDSKGVILSAQSDTPRSGGQDDRADTLRERVLRLLEARVGAGNAVVEISVDTVTETESIRERRVDPDSRVIVSTETQETSNSTVNSGGDVTVASNLPDTEEGGADSANSRNAETRERVSYKVSETELEIHKAPGAIRRLTVAVLVNGLRVSNTDGTVAYEERSQEELTALQDLVASAVGLDPERGDVITLKSMELPAAEPLGTAAYPGFLDRFGLSAMPLIKMALVAVVSLILGLFVLRPILTAPARRDGPDLLPSAALSGEPMAARSPQQALTGEIEDAPGGALETPHLPAVTNPTAAANASAPAVERLRALIGERQEESIEILRGWLNEKGQAQ